MPALNLQGGDDEAKKQYLHAFMERSNMEVMARVTPVVLAACVFGFVSTFTPFAVWANRPAETLLCYRLVFAAIAALCAICGFLSSAYLKKTNPTPRVGNIVLATFTILLIGLSLWITIIDFAELRRYFLLLVALFAVFGLYYIPPLQTLVCETVVCAVMLGCLGAIGLLSSIQVITLVAYLLIILAVSYANYVSRKKVGITNEQILSASRHDDLTGALNRRAFDEDAPSFEGTDIYLMLADVDEFNYYNDLYGHVMGDELLKYFARTLIETFGAGRTYHLISDRFIVVVPNISETEFMDQVNAWRERFRNGTVGDKQVDTTCSAGCVYGHVSRATDLEDFVQIASVLLRQSKELGRDRFIAAEYSEGLSREAITKSATSEMPQESVDPLTGLMSQDYFIEHASEIAPVMLERKHSVSFVYCNVTNIKDYNAKYGFEQGDELLKAVAGALQEVFPGRMVSRFGDDRFAIMTDDDGLVAAIDRASQIVSRARGEQFTSLRAGIFRYVSPDIEVRYACDCARIACESLRGNYDVLCRYYTDELGDRMSQRSQILDQFGKALRCGYIQPFYQPIVRSVSNSISEFEVLARWVEDDGTMMSPASFIPALENAHLIHLLDLRIVEEVCKNFRKSIDQGRAVCPVSINFSRLDFEACDLVKTVVGLLDEYDLPHELICVELTESAFSENAEGIKEALDEFRAQGMQIWMDDFGSGYSALNVLREYDFDLVKFDMVFLRGLDVDDPNDPSAIMLSNMVSMAKELGLQTLIEGVESVEARRLLRSISFDRIQGYVYDRPRSCDEAYKRVDEGAYAVESLDRRAYYDRLSRVNIIRPDAGTDLLGTSEGLPAAIVEYVDGKVSYRVHNAAFLKRLEQMGISGIAESEKRLNMAVPNEGLIGVHAAIAAVRDTDEWVTVRQPHANQGVGFARCLARIPEENTYAFIYFD